jgi:hypothetical protein
VLDLLRAFLQQRKDGEIAQRSRTFAKRPKGRPEKEYVVEHVQHFLFLFFNDMKMGQRPKMAKVRTPGASDVNRIRRTRPLDGRTESGAEDRVEFISIVNRSGLRECVELVIVEGMCDEALEVREHFAMFSSRNWSK